MAVNSEAAREADLVGPAVWMRETVSEIRAFQDRLRKAQPPVLLAEDSGAAPEAAQVVEDLAGEEEAAVAADLCSAEDLSGRRRGLMR